jgi:hypothetical protein
MPIAHILTSNSKHGVSLSTKITTLANRFNTHLKSTADVDALESYPGSDSSNAKKLQAAIKAAHSDVIHIKETYQMYKSQLEHAKQQMNHQIQLLEFANKVRAIIDDMKNDGNTFDAFALREKIKLIEKEAATLGKELHIKISLMELDSLRLLKAFLSDEAAKSLPKLPPTDWAAMSRLKHMDNSGEATDILTDKDIINEKDDESPDTRRFGPVSGPPPATQKSPRAPELTDTVLAQ